MSTHALKTQLGKAQETKPVFTAEVENALAILPAEAYNKFKIGFSNFIETIPKIKFFKPDGKPKKELKLFYADDWDSACAMASDAMHAAARATGGKRGLVEARIAVETVLRDASREKARIVMRGIPQIIVRELDAIESAKWDIERVVEQVVALMSDYMLAADLDFPGKGRYKALVKKFFEVLSKGDGLVDSVDGVIFAYSIGKPPEERKTTNLNEIKRKAASDGPSSTGEG